MNGVLIIKSDDVVDLSYIFPDDFWLLQKSSSIILIKQ